MKQKRETIITTTTDILFWITMGFLFTASYLLLVGHF